MIAVAFEDVPLRTGDAIEELRAVLGREFSVFDRSIDNHVSSLRKKLGNRMNGIERIKSVRGTGYIYAAVDR